MLAEFHGADSAVQVHAGNSHVAAVTMEKELFTWMTVNCQLFLSCQSVCFVQKRSVRFVQEFLLNRPSSIVVCFKNPLKLV